MRSGKFFFVLSLTVLACLAGWGCSDDSPTTSNLTEQEQNYQAVQTEVNEFLDTAIAQVATGLQLASTSVPVDTAISVVFTPINPDSVNRTANWVVIYSSNLATAFSAYRIDSLQFRKNGLVQDSVIGCDAISLRHHFNFEYGDTTASFRNRQGYATFELTGLNTNTAVVNGTRDISIQTRQIIRGQNWRRNYDMEMTFTNMTVPRGDNGWNTACPNSGTMTGTVNLNAVRGTGTPAESSWSFEVVFEGGVATATVTSGEISRTYTKTICE